MSSIWVIPDIHGRKDLFDDLMLKLGHRLNFEGGDKLIFLGDMVDRGIGSAAVIGVIRSLQSSVPKNVIVLGGNHEWLMIDAYRPGSQAKWETKDLWHINGGRATELSFPGEKVPDEVLDWAANLPLYHEESGFFFSHAPVPSGAERSALTKSQLIWSYPGKFENEAPYAMNFGKGTVGVCGHIHALRSGVLAPRFYEHYIYADAGCGCSPKAPLVAIEVKSREVIYAWPAEAMGTQS